MSNQSRRFPETPAEYNAHLDRRLERIPGMNLRRWKLFKSILLSLAVLVFAVFAILQGADPTAVALPAIIVAALVAGVEWSELVAVWAETKLEYDDRRENDR
jgi:4-amino-4-deoxy-L-arabinose transferase-like glycosyltransferase